MPIEPPGPVNHPFVRARDKKFPRLEQMGNSLSFLSDDPLVPLPVIDLEPLPVIEPELTEDDGEPTVAHKFHIPLGLIVNIRV